MWMDEIGKPLPSSSRGWICSKHFMDKYLGKKFLKKGAVPSKHLCCVDKPSTSQDISFPESCDHTPPLFEMVAQSDFSSFKLPATWGIHKSEQAIVICKMLIGEHDQVSIDCMLLIKQGDMLKAHVKDKWLNMADYSITMLEDLVTFIGKMDNMKICEGGSQSCKIIIDGKQVTCKQCKGYNYFLRINKTVNIIKKRNRSKLVLYMKRQNRHYKKVIMNLKEEKIDENKLEIFIRNLPPIQREMIEACHKAAKTTGPGNRYTLEWIYQCIIMKIKSPKLYFHMRDNNILALPSPSTLSKYIRNIDGSFGFNKEMFDMLKEKTQHFEQWQRHGCLLIDECKITATKKFDKNTMKFIGFVDLGDHTPKEMENTLGDHALVIMYQPFAGHGLQALACFLTKGNINGNIQAKIILECIILCENAGLLIDVVTSDGASWNRSMWKELGVQNPLEPWCEHPVNSERKLMMCSDFPHLIKCLRNILENKKTFQVPEGVVKHIHFQRLYEHESKTEFKMAYKLTPSHIHPKCGEKMCTRLAFQLFSNTTALALETYMDKYELFADTNATIAFCKRINRIVDIMNSSSPMTGLRYQSKEYEELEDFISYLDLWEQCCPPNMFLSKSTCDGLKATISCTLELVKYLRNEIGFEYLMTSRINQDHLEHFFGMMRSAGGCNNHPESIQVGHIFRLMSLHSLIKPPRGSNITGGEMMKTLLKVGELKSERQKKFVFDINLEEGIQQMIEDFSRVEEAFAYFCGYVAKKMRTSTECEDCKESILGQGNEIYNSYISKKSRGFLTFPSQKIILFLQEVEQSISSVFEAELKRNCLQEIFAKLTLFKPTKLLGCEQHKLSFSKNVLQTFIISRLSICCAKEQKIRKNNNKSKHLAKMAKLN